MTVLVAPTGVRQPQAILLAGCRTPWRWTSDQCRLARMAGLGEPPCMGRIHPRFGNNLCRPACRQRPLRRDVVWAIRFVHGESAWTASSYKTVRNDMKSLVRDAQNCSVKPGVTRRTRRRLARQGPRTATRHRTTWRCCNVAVRNQQGTGWTTDGFRQAKSLESDHFRRRRRSGWHVIGRK